MKSTPIIFQDFSIAGIRKQWEKQQYFSLEKPCLRGNERECNLHNTSCENCYDNYKRWVDANRPGFIGAKTETRRTRGLDKINENPNEWRLMTHSKPFDIKPDEYFFVKNEPYAEVLIKCPYGKVGDELWVKEAYAEFCLFGRDIENESMEVINRIYNYRADVGSEGMANDIINGWKSPLFMRKSASRIKLEITGLSIERLHQITEEGAIREGVARNGSNFWNNYKDHHTPCASARNSYFSLWATMHTSFDKNPFVWVIQFTVKEFKL